MPTPMTKPSVPEGSWPAIGAEGTRTVLVTCTNGEKGDGPDGAKPGQAAHDPAAVAATRLAELRAAVRYLGVAHLELLIVRQRLAEAGVDVDAQGLPPDFGTPDELITTTVDVSAYMDRKLAAPKAHTSQVENFFLTRLPEDVIALALSHEYFTLRSAPAGYGNEDDLFAGLR